MSVMSTPERWREPLARARAAVFAKASPAAAHVPDRAGVIYKTREDSLVAAAKPQVARTEADDSLIDRSADVAPTTESELPWWQWVQRHCDYRMDIVNESVAQVIAWTKDEMSEECEREVGIVKRELELMRREVSALREQVGLERGLRALRDEVAEARAEVPKLPAVTARLEAEQARLRDELDAAKRKMQGNQLVMDGSLSKLRKEAAAARAATASVELKLEETSSSSFVMQTIHPAAAAALREFALRTFDPAGAA